MARLVGNSYYCLCESAGDKILKSYVVRSCPRPATVGKSGSDPCLGFELRPYKPLHGFSRPLGTDEIRLSPSEVPSSHSTEVLLKLREFGPVVPLGGVGDVSCAGRLFPETKEPGPGSRICPVNCSRGPSRTIRRART